MNFSLNELAYAIICNSKFLNCEMKVIIVTIKEYDLNKAVRIINNRFRVICTTFNIAEYC